MADVTFENDIAFINLGSGENRLDIAKMKALHKALDKVLANEDVAALICTADGKYFSNGISLQVLTQSNEEEFKAFWVGYFTVLLRILCFPMPTICAINGHAFAGGCFLSLAFDYRVMNSDKCWISANEVYMPARLPTFLMYFIREKLPSNTQRVQVLTLGKRFTAQEALRHDVVQAIAPAHSVIDKAKEIARERLRYGPLPRGGCEDLKLDLYKDLIAKYHVDFMEKTPQLPLPKL